MGDLICGVGWIKWRDRGVGLLVFGGRMGVLGDGGYERVESMEYEPGQLDSCFPFFFCEGFGGREDLENGSIDVG